MESLALQSVLYSAQHKANLSHRLKSYSLAKHPTLMLNGQIDSTNFSSASGTGQAQPQFGALQWTRKFPFLKKKPPATPQEAEKIALAVLKEPEKPAVDFAKLADAIERPTEASSTEFIDNLFKTHADQVKKDVLVLQDNGSFAGSPFRLVVKKGSTPDKNLLWLDIHGTAESRVFKRMAKTFTLTDFQHENPENGDIHYDTPVVDHDSVQLTMYCLKIDKGTPQDQWDKMTRKEKAKAKPLGETLKKEEMYLYGGKHFLISVHPEERPSIDKTIKLLTETGKDKAPSELMAFIINENITRYSLVANTLYSDLRHMSEKAGQKTIDQSAVLNDGLKMGQKISDLHLTINQQLGVLNRLAELNEFHESPLFEPIKIAQHNERLQGLLRDLAHHQDVKEALDANIQARIGNEMNTIMKKGASLAVMAIPTTAAGALWGMNVPVPGGNVEDMFTYIAGGVGIVTGSMFLALKRFKWL